jgi:hypothetical protein
MSHPSELEIELDQYSNSPFISPGKASDIHNIGLAENIAARTTNNLRTVLSSWRKRLSKYICNSKPYETRAAQSIVHFRVLGKIASHHSLFAVEDYRPGYPRFSALIAANASFHLCRRFTNLRARLLLLKQDRLSSLENQLEKIDREETAALFLGSSRRDGNRDRNSVLSDIDTALADYGAAHY